MNIHFISANITNDTDAFGKLDPFVEVKFGKDSWTSKKYEDAGLKPVFNNEVSKVKNNCLTIDFGILLNTLIDNVNVL